MTITTVTGDREADELGQTLSHEHVLIDLYRVYQPHRDMRLHDTELAIQELRAFAAVGGGTIVDLTTSDIGRDPAELARISRESGVGIVMGTGRYREPFYEPEIWRRTVADLAAEFVRDIETGVDGVRAGVVGEIGTDTGFVSPVEERVHRAAARAAIATGRSIVTHSLGSPVGLAQLALFEEEGLDAGRVAIGHADTWPDDEYHAELLDRGAYLMFDTVRGAVPYETQRTIRCIQRAIAEGYAHRVLLSQDVCMTGHLQAYGGNGYSYVPGAFGDVLAASGVDPAFLRDALTTNVHSFLQGTGVK